MKQKNYKITAFIFAGVLCSLFIYGIIKAANSGSGSVTVNIPANFSGSASVDVDVTGKDASNNSLADSVTLNISCSPVNAICGSSQGQNFLTEPTTNLCADGATPTVNNLNPGWSWTCPVQSTSCGGKSASCSATNTPGPVKGVCGFAAANYAASNTSFFGNFCTIGSPVDSNGQAITPIFPGAGSSTSWQCSGLNGGGMSALCTATVAAHKYGCNSSGSCVLNDATGAFTLSNCNNSCSGAVCGGSGQVCCSDNSCNSSLSCSNGICSPPPLATINGVCANVSGDPANILVSALCSSGTASAVSGSGPWSWTCVGSGVGHTDASCNSSVIQPSSLVLSVVPSFRVINVGASAVYDVELDASKFRNNYYSYIRFTIDNCPAGATCTFSKNDINDSAFVPYGRLSSPATLTLTIAGAPLGTYNGMVVHAVAWDSSGGWNETADATIGLRVGPLPPPTCTSVTPAGGSIVNGTSGFFNVFANGVSSDVTEVRFPTWGETNGQNDIDWYWGTNMGGGKWGAAINLANHAVGNTEYGNIITHVYMTAPGFVNTWCGGTYFTRPAPAVCDNTWRREPSGGWSANQPVGAYVNSSLSTQFKDSIYMVVRGDSDYLYGQRCAFAGANCFFGGWMPLTSGGVTKTSPFLWIGSAPDAYYLSYTNQSWHNINWAAGWTGWVNLGVQPYPWGTPFRTKDKNGQWWQFKTDPSTGNIMYNCGPAQVCVNLSFVSGAVSPSSVNPKGAFSVVCDFGAYNDATNAVIGDGSTDGNCSYVSFGPGSKANFNCTAPTVAGSYPIYCKTNAGTSDNICPVSQKIGDLIVTSVGGPSVDLKVNGQDTSVGSPLTVPRKDSSSINLTWTVANADTCTATKSASAPGAWSGAKDKTSGSNTLGSINVSGAHNYTLSCTGPGGNSSDTVYISVPVCNTLPFVSGNVSPSSVSASGAYTAVCDYGVVNNQISPVVGSGSCSFTNFTGTVANFSCTAGTTVGTYTNNCKLSGPIAPDYYCASTDSINNLSVVPGPTGGPGNKIDAKIATCPVSGVVLTWTAASGANTYNVYRSTHGGSSALLAGNIGNVLTYTDISGTAGTLYDYWVEGKDSVSGLVSTSQTPANTNTSGIAKNTCGSGPGPLTVTVNNGVCGLITVSWSSVAGATYNVYRNTTGNFPVTADRIKQGATGNSYSDVSAPGLYYYWVTSVVAGSESAFRAPTVGSNPFGLNACAPNLSSSDKDITAVNDSAIPTSNCNGTDSIPASVQLSLNDKIKFAINLCNSGSAAATGMTVTDRLTNLAMPSTGWNAKYNDGTGDKPILASNISVTGSAPNQIITFKNIPNLPKPGAVPPAIRRITFEAKLSVPTNFSASSARFQNGFTATYKEGSISKYTPLIQFYTGKGIPTIIEIP